MVGRAQPAAGRNEEFLRKRSPWLVVWAGNVLSPPFRTVALPPHTSFSRRTGKQVASYFQPLGNLPEIGFLSVDRGRLETFLASEREVVLRHHCSKRTSYLRFDDCFEGVMQSLFDVDLENFTRALLRFDLDKTDDDDLGRVRALIAE